MGIDNYLKSVEEAEALPFVDVFAGIVVVVTKTLFKIVGIVALIIVGIKMSIDIIFINNKPLFYKIIEAKEALNAGQGATFTARVKKALTGAVDVIGNQGPLGFITYILALFPNPLFFSNYIQVDGQIDRTAADNATMMNWVATKMWKQLLAAVACVFIASGVLLDLLVGTVNTVNRSKSLANAGLSYLDTKITDMFGVTENELVYSDSSFDKIRKEAVEAAQEKIPTIHYKFSGDDQTASRKYLEALVGVTILESAPFKDFQYLAVPYNSRNLSVAVQVDQSRATDKCTTDPTEKCNAFNQAQGWDSSGMDQKNEWSWYAPINLKNDGDVIVCSDVNYPGEGTWLQLKVSIKLKTSKEYITQSVKDKGTGGGGGGTQTKKQGKNQVQEGTVKVEGVNIKYWFFDDKDAVEDEVVDFVEEELNDNGYTPTSVKIDDTKFKITVNHKGSGAKDKEFDIR